MAYQPPTPRTAIPAADVAIPVNRLVFDPKSGTYVQRDKARRFIKGPISFYWMQRANSLPGKAGATAIALSYLKGVKQATTFAVTAEAESLAACSRQAFARALAVLETAGLISVQRRPGARPMVTLIDVETISHHQ